MRMDNSTLRRKFPRCRPFLGGLVVVPAGLLAQMGSAALRTGHPVDTQAAAARARAIIMEIERDLGFVPTDREFDKLGYDIESSVPEPGSCGSSKSKAAFQEPLPSP